VPLFLLFLLFCFCFCFLFCFCFFCFLCTTFYPTSGIIMVPLFLVFAPRSVWQNVCIYAVGVTQRYNSRTYCCDSYQLQNHMRRGLGARIYPREGLPGGLIKFASGNSRFGVANQNWNYLHFEKYNLTPRNLAYICEAPRGERWNLTIFYCSPLRSMLIYRPPGTSRISVRLPGGLRFYLSECR